jgi:hypothetical protein
MQYMEVEMGRRLMVNGKVMDYAARMCAKAEEVSTMRAAMCVALPALRICARRDGADGAR